MNLNSEAKKLPLAPLCLFVFGIAERIAGERKQESVGQGSELSLTSAPLALIKCPRLEFYFTGEHTQTWGVISGILRAAEKKQTICHPVYLTYLESNMPHIKATV
jgi:hypothetical protein